MKEKIIEWLNNQAEKKNITITDDMDLYENDILDSFGIIALLSFLIEDNGVCVKTEDMIPENFVSVNKILELVERTK